MIAVVMAANRISLIPSPRDGPLGLVGAMSKAFLDGDELDESDLRLGRHLRTESTDALHGWTWSG